MFVYWTIWILNFNIQQRVKRIMLKEFDFVTSVGYVVVIALGMLRLSRSVCCSYHVWYVVAIALCLSLLVGNRYRVGYVVAIALGLLWHLRWMCCGHRVMDVVAFAHGMIYLSRRFFCGYCAEYDVFLALCMIWRSLRIPYRHTKYDSHDIPSAIAMTCILWLSRWVCCGYLAMGILGLLRWECCGYRARYVVAIALCLSRMSLLVSHGYRVRYVVGVGLGMSWLSFWIFCVYRGMYFVAVALCILWSSRLNVCVIGFGMSWLSD